MPIIKTVSGQEVQTDGLQIGAPNAAGVPEKIGFNTAPIAPPEVDDAANVAAVVTALKALGLFVDPA